SRSRDKHHSSLEPRAVPCALIPTFSFDEPFGVDRWMLWYKRHHNPKKTARLMRYCHYQIMLGVYTESPTRSWIIALAVRVVSGRESRQPLTVNGKRKRSAITGKEAGRNGPVLGGSK